MDKSTYLLDPCGASSFPFWKTNSISIPDDLLILREDDPRLDTAAQQYVDTPYFKLIHTMQGIGETTLPSGLRFVRPSAQALLEHIAACYDEERASEEELLNYRRHVTFPRIFG